MTELKIEAYSLPEAPKFNYDELKASLIERTKDYKTTVYGEDQIKQAKADRSELNKISKALNDERIRLEKEYNKPFSVFKEQVNEVIGIIKEASGAIDEQVKAFELKEKQTKENDCRELFLKKNKYEWLQYEQVAKATWLNKSTKIDAIEMEIDMQMASIETNLNALTGLEYEFEAKEYFKKSLNLAESLDLNRQYIQLAKRKQEEQARIEAEKAARESAEQARIEAEKAAEQKSKIEEMVEAQAAEHEKPAEPEERFEMTLMLKISTSEYDEIEKFLNERGINWRMV